MDVGDVSAPVRLEVSTTMLLEASAGMLVTVNVPEVTVLFF